MVGQDTTYALITFRDRKRELNANTTS